MYKKKQVSSGGTSESYIDLKGQKMDIKSILKDIEFLGSSHMTWKERKELENRKVVSLGGKPPKKHRLPLSVARVTMKKRKERDQKMLQESLILGRFGGTVGSGAKKVAEKRKLEDQVLKSTKGRFRNGVLDVKHLLRPSASRDTDDNTHAAAYRGNNKKGGKKNQGKKGGNRKRH